MSEHVEGRFVGAAGSEIYWQGWLPGEAVGVAVVVHGYAEHSGRYTHVADRLVAAGFATYAIDHNGHGRSAGRRGNVERLTGVEADLDRLLRIAAERHPGLPVFVVAHSLGALLALDYVLGTPYPLRGLVLSGTPLDVAVGSKAERIAAKVLSSVIPDVPVTPFAAGLVSRDPKVVAAYDADPLNYRGRVKVRMGAEVLAGIDRVQPKLSAVELPLLILHGAADKVNLASGAERLAAEAGSPDVTLKVYPGLYHEVFNEPEQDQVLDDVAAWLTARL